MKIGLISDTHGNHGRTRKAIEVFEREQVEAILHCGDVGSLEVLQLFVGRPFWFVWGNLDHPEPSWRRALEDWGMSWPEESPLRFELAGKRIVLAHGHERAFPATFRDPDADFLFCGHTHVAAMSRVWGCIFVNPGAVHRASPPTVAIVDLACGQVRHVGLDGGPVKVE